MNTLKDVKAKARAINGDIRADWMDDASLVPMLNHCYRLQISRLARTHSMFAERLVVQPNITAGTSDLGVFQSDSTQPLSGLWVPYRDGVWWKQAGLPDNYYRPARETSRLPNINPSTPGQQCEMSWEWRGRVIFITPMQFAVDLQVRGDFLPPPLLQDEDYITIHPLLGEVLAEEAAACAWRERANPGQMQSYILLATEALDDIASQLVAETQAVPLRIGRITGHHRRCGR